MAAHRAPLPPSGWSKTPVVLPRQPPTISLPAQPILTAQGTYAASRQVSEPLPDLFQGDEWTVELPKSGDPRGISDSRIDRPLGAPDSPVEQIETHTDLPPARRGQTPSIEAEEPAVAVAVLHQRVKILMGFVSWSNDPHNFLI